MAKYNVKHKDLLNQASSLWSAGNTYAYFESRLNTIANSMDSRDSNMASLKTQVKNTAMQIPAISRRITLSGTAVNEISTVYVSAEKTINSAIAAVKITNLLMQPNPSIRALTYLPDTMAAAVGAAVTGKASSSILQKLYDSIKSFLTVMIESIAKWFESLFGGGRSEDDNYKPNKPGSGTIITNPNGNVTNPRQGQEIVPKYMNKPGSRDPDAYSKVLHQFDVTTNERYKKVVRNGKTLTWCNIFVWDVTIAMGCEIPHYYNPNTGEKTASRVSGEYLEMTADRMANWLRDFGPSNGWEKISASDAQKFANEGYPVVVAAPGGGHVAMVCPSRAEGPMITQAGANNFEEKPVKNGFGSLTVEYYVHL